MANPIQKVAEMSADLQQQRVEYSEIKFFYAIVDALIYLDESIDRTNAGLHAGYSQNRADFQSLVDEVRTLREIAP
jgi:hypothetical protein